MAVASSAVIEESPQADGTKWLRYRYTFDSGCPPLVAQFRLPTATDPASDMASKVAVAEAWELKKLGRLESEALVSEPDWDNSDGRSLHRKETARRHLQRALRFGIERADDAWKLAKQIIPWVLAQGWTNAQIRDFLGITQGELVAINNWWAMMDSGTINGSYRAAWNDMQDVFDAVNGIRFGKPGSSE